MGSSCRPLPHLLVGWALLAPGNLGGSPTSLSLCFPHQAHSVLGTGDPPPQEVPTHSSKSRPPSPCRELGPGPQEGLSCSDQCWRAGPAPPCPARPGCRECRGLGGWGQLCNHTRGSAKAAWATSSLDVCGDRKDPLRNPEGRQLTRVDDGRLTPAVQASLPTSGAAQPGAAMFPSRAPATHMGLPASWGPDACRAGGAPGVLPGVTSLFQEALASKVPKVPFQGCSRERRESWQRL